jgi:hypothetical protein
MDQAVRTNLLRELEGYVTTLPTDPNVAGIDTIFKLSSVITAYRDRVGGIYGEAIEWLKDAQKTLKTAEAAYESKSYKYMNEDAVKILKSADIRKAAIDVYVAAERNAVLKAELEVMDATAFKERVFNKYDDLKDALRTLKRQLEAVGFLFSMGVVQVPPGFQPNSYPGGGQKVRLGNGDNA